MRIVLREVDDWIAVYKDGDKVWENHSCDLESGLRALDIPFDRTYYEETDDYGNVLVGGQPFDAFPEKLPGSSGPPPPPQLAHLYEGENDPLYQWPNPPRGELPR